jgi:hypothetical protein
VALLLYASFGAHEPQAGLHAAPLGVVARRHRMRIVGGRAKAQGTRDQGKRHAAISLEAAAQAPGCLVALDAT